MNTSRTNRDACEHTFDISTDIAREVTSLTVRIEVRTNLQYINENKIIVVKTNEARRREYRPNINYYSKTTQYRKQAWK